MARILVIEDDEVTLETSALLLRHAGYRVSTAASGRDGFQEVLSERYDLVLADLSLGDMTAIDLLEHMRAAGVDVPVVVITGFGSIEATVQAMRRGAIDFLEKPLDGEELIHKIERNLAQAAAIRRSTSEPHAHSAARWANAVVGLIDARADAPTVGLWGRAVHVSASTLRAWCQRTGVGARESLALARFVRAVHQSRNLPWRPAQRLVVTDPRTLTKMLAAAGLPLEAERVSLRELLAKQSLIGDADALAALRLALARFEPTLLFE